jgi:nitroreductase
MRYIVWILVILVTAIAFARVPSSGGPSPWMFVWVGDDDRQHDDFLAFST